MANPIERRLGRFMVAHRVIEDNITPIVICLPPGSTYMYSMFDLSTATVNIVFAHPKLRAVEIGELIPAVYPTINEVDYDWIIEMVHTYLISGKYVEMLDQLRETFRYKITWPEELKEDNGKNP